MKILFLSIEYPPETGGGGIGSYMASVAPALVNRGHEVHVLSCLEGQKQSDNIREGVYIHRRGITHIRGLGRLGKILGLNDTVRRIHTGLSAFLEYRRLKINLDVIEHPDWGAEGWIFALLKIRPTVAHLHTPLPLIRKHNDLPETFDTYLASFLEHISIKHADAITSTSRLLIGELRNINWIKNSSFEIIPHPIDWPKWSNLKPVSETGPTVLFLGRLEQRKAPELLLQAISIIQKEIPQVKGVFVGRNSGLRDGLSYFDWMKKNLESASECQFINQVPRHELSRFLSESRILVMPSWFESYGMVAVEAMAAGRPVVVTKTSGVAEFVEPRRLGRVIPPGDSLSLSEAILPFLRDPSYAARVGERAKSAVMNELDPNRIAARRELVYRKAVEVFCRRLRLSARGFRFAIPNKVGKFEIPRKWRNWVISQTVELPWKHFYLPTARQLLELIGQIPSFSRLDNLDGIRILDLGCTPTVSLLLACLGAKVFILDIDPSELRKAKEGAQLLGVGSNVICILADAFKIPFNPQSFHVVWNSGFIEHFDNPEQILQQMGHVLCLRGGLIVLVPNRWTPHSLWVREHLRKKPNGYYWDYMGLERSYSRNELTKLIKSSGFHVIKNSAGNLRRTILDDSIILPRLGRMFMRGFLFMLMNLADWVEIRIPFLNRFGFMTGALGIRLPKNDGEIQTSN